MNINAYHSGGQHTDENSDNNQSERPIIVNNANNNSIALNSEGLYSEPAMPSHSNSTAFQNAFSGNLMKDEL